LDVCDKVLRYAGLTDGQASTNTVSLESIKASIAKSDVTFTEDDISYLKTEYNVDITNWKHLVAKDIKKELARTVTKGCGMTLVGKQQCNGGPRYYTWKLHKNKNKNCS
jgi:actin-like ATPase involved in cell morphogenesis